jgi:hypothetical protein
MTRYPYKQKNGEVWNLAQKWTMNVT